MRLLARGVAFCDKLLQQIHWFPWKMESLSPRTYFYCVIKVGFLFRKTNLPRDSSPFHVFRRKLYSEGNSYLCRETS